MDQNQKGSLDTKKQPKNINNDLRFTNKVVKDGLRNVASHHVESFNYAMDKCLPRINQYMLTAEVTKPEKSDIGYSFNKMSIWFEDFELRTPERSGVNSSIVKNEIKGSDNSKMYPYECRMRSLTYSAPLHATVARKFDKEPEERVTMCLGDLPVMVTSKFCNLNGLDEDQLAKKKEDGYEFGGYFIINGNERIIRMLIMNKRNYPIAF